MTETVTIHKAKTELSKLLARVEAPVAKLVAADPTPKPKRKPGRMKGMFTIGPEFFEPLSDEELKLWGIE
jgi:antitoxin (DNA-binding transcriptional repressor) of toxin-antitoxin stability system